jgi:hypothetical protein
MERAKAAGRMVILLGDLALEVRREERRRSPEPS